jgi:hypothetical protein
MGHRLNHRLVKFQHPASEGRLSQRVVDRNREFLASVVEFQPYNLTSNGETDPRFPESS